MSDRLLEVDIAEEKLPKIIDVVRTYSGLEWEFEVFGELKSPQRKQLIKTLEEMVGKNLGLDGKISDYWHKHGPGILRGEYYPYSIGDLFCRLYSFKTKLDGKFGKDIMKFDLYHGDARIRGAKSSSKYNKGVKIVSFWKRRFCSMQSDRWEIDKKPYRFIIWDAARYAKEKYKERARQLETELLKRFQYLRKRN